MKGKTVNVLSLDAMMGQTWKHNAKVYTFGEYRKDGKKTSIATDKGFLEFETHEELSRFLAVCTKCEALPAKATALPASKHEDADLMLSIRDSLMTDLKKLSEDATYIKQATAKTKTVKSLIELSKLRMALEK